LKKRRIRKQNRGKTKRRKIKRIPKALCQLIELMHNKRPASSYKMILTKISMRNPKKAKKNKVQENKMNL
jgi:hypothetical protein